MLKMLISEYCYDVLSTLSSSYQGVLVTTLLCFTNTQAGGGWRAQVGYRLCGRCRRR